jgi:hypothetical protein
VEQLHQQLLRQQTQVEEQLRQQLLHPQAEEEQLRHQHLSSQHRR